MVWVLSNYVVLPEPGGWFDQDPAVQHDLRVLLSEYQRISHELPLAREAMLDAELLPNFDEL